MCGRNSKHGIRGIAIGLFLLSLVASPCFSASSWDALFIGDSEKGVPIVSENQVVTVLPGESSPATPTESPQTYDERTLKDLQKQLETLQKKQESLEMESEKLASSATEFLTLSENSRALGEITDAQYEEMLATANAFAGKNSEQADRIAELESLTGSKGYMMVDAIIGFEDVTPTYGLGLTIGIRVGNHLMLELGTDYTIGKFSPAAVNQFSLDNFEFRAGVGWMF